MLQTMAGQFEDAEESLLATLDFTSSGNPLTVYGLAILYEAQDRLDDAGHWMVEGFKAMGRKITEPASVEEIVMRVSPHVLLQAMFALVAARSGATSVAKECLEVMLACKAKSANFPALAIALALTGMGRFDEAVKCLHDAAFEQSEPLVMWFHIFPPLRHLHGHKGFGQLLEKLKLTPQRS